MRIAERVSPKITHSRLPEMPPRAPPTQPPTTIPPRATQPPSCGSRRTSPTTYTAATATTHATIVQPTDRPYGAWRGECANPSLGDGSQLTTPRRGEPLIRSSHFGLSEVGRKAWCP